MKKPLFPLVLAMFLVVLPIGVISFGNPLANAKEINSPSDRIKIDDLTLSNEKLIINYENIHLAQFEDTNSMDPVLDDKSIGIEIVPDYENEINEGDIVAYESEYGIIIHRVEKISYDNDGWYATMKGDNNSVSDPYNVRFDQIKYVLVGVLY
ncbi:MAG: hypothetical protein PHT54_00840 [Candidatus Nanoarchaeia archaeon]|nr:hypothetical protein [Candidatus Nanoarchaeia archaeon]